MEVGVKKVVRSVKGKFNNMENSGFIYEVISNGKYRNGSKFRIGDKYRILQHDKGAFLIEKIGDPNSPYFVSGEFLSSISDFNAEDFDDTI